MATFTNQARLTYTGGSAASNITVGELVQVLTAAKTAVVPIYRRDGAVTYLITLTNTGTTPLTGLTVTDDLGGYAFGTGTLYPLAVCVVLGAMLLVIAACKPLRRSLHKKFFI